MGDGFTFGLVLITHCIFVVFKNLFGNKVVCELRNNDKFFELEVEEVHRSLERTYRIYRRYRGLFSSFFIIEM